MSTMLSPLVVTAVAGIILPTRRKERPIRSLDTMRHVVSP
jgi:hypothetical protein